MYVQLNYIFTEIINKVSTIILLIIKNNISNTGIFCNILKKKEKIFIIDTIARKFKQYFSLSQ